MLSNEVVTEDTKDADKLSTIEEKKPIQIYHVSNIGIHSHLFSTSYSANQMSISDTCTLLTR